MRFAAMRQLIDLDSRIYGTRKRVGGAAAPEGPDESGKRAKIINYDDELLWKVISEDEDWDNGGSCLRRMLEHAPAAQVAVILSRAESLAGNSNPKRILNLVGLYRNYGPDTRKRVFTNESSLRREVLDSNTSNNLRKILSLLQNALRQSTGSNAIAEVREQLLDVYLQLGQYANAEEEFNKLAAAQTPDPLLLKKMAVLTMESADRERAMRLWKLAVKLDPADLRGIQVLAYFGLHDDLLRYYQEYQKADHESWIPTEALKLIHAPFRGPRWAEFQVN
jgi:tetratricopeptide (TPR) repeat protein